LSLFFYLFSIAISLWRWKFVTAYVTVVFVNNQQVVFSDEDKILIKVCIWRVTEQRDSHANFLRKAGQSVVLISCWKSCRTQTQLTGGQAVTNLAVPTLKKTTTCAVCLHVHP